MSGSRRQLRISIVLNYINMGIGTLIPIFYTPVMLSLLGQDEYGLYKLSSSVTSYLSLISLGISSAITRYLIKERSEKGKDAEEKMLGLFLVIFQVIAVICFIVGMILVFNLDVWYGSSLTADELERMRILVFLMVCNMSLSFSMSPYTSAVTAHEEFVFLECMNILSTCIAPILNITVLFLGYASIGMAVSTLALGVLSRFCYLEFVRRKLKLKPRYKHLPVSQLRDILTFSFWIFVSNVSAQLCNTTDIAMIGAIPNLATTGVAIYNIGTMFNTILSSLTTGVSSLLTPRANKMVFSGATNTELSDLAIKVGRIQAYIVVLIVFGFISFGQPFILFYTGEGYEEAYWVAVFMMIPSAIPLVQSMCLSIIVARNRHRFRSVVCLCITIANVIGTWILLQYWGIVGAAFMTGVTLLLGNGLVLNWYYWKRIGLNIPQFWREVGVIFCIPFCMTIVSLLLGYFINWYNVIFMLMGIVGYTIVYCVLNWQFVMNNYEKELFTALIQRILRKVREK